MKVAQARCFGFSFTPVVVYISDTFLLFYSIAVLDLSRPGRTKWNYSNELLSENISSPFPHSVLTCAFRLIQHPALSGPCRDDVVKQAQQAVTFLEKRQQFWAKQKPVYTRQMERRRALGLLGPTSGGGRGKRRASSARPAARMERDAGGASSVRTTNRSSSSSRGARTARSGDRTPSDAGGASSAGLTDRSSSGVDGASSASLTDRSSSGVGGASSAGLTNGTSSGVGGASSAGLTNGTSSGVGSSTSPTA